MPIRPENARGRDQGEAQGRGAATGAAAVTDRPIIFSAPMILALLREANEPGTGKSQTRRLRWTGKRAADGEGFYPSVWTRVEPGDRLWCRENFFLGDFGGERQYRGRNVRAYYAADFGRDIREHTDKITPCIHMPRRHSRLTLVVTGAKTERLQDISEQDCEREGVRWDGDAELWHIMLPSGQIVPGDTAQSCFRMLWVALNGREAWTSNPEVVAVSFRVHLANVDAMKEAA